MLEIKLNKLILSSDNEPKIILAGISIQPDFSQVCSQGVENIHFVLDHSGSMSGGRLKQLKKAFEYVIDTIDEDAQINCGSNELSPRKFPMDCLSSLLLFTDKADGAYSASVNIYDHLGKWIHSSLQRFGNCEEMKNESNKNNSSI